MNHTMSFSGETLLFIGAHPDDIELGCGALISQIVKQANVVCVTLSDNQKNPALKTIVTEHYNSMAVLQVPRENIIVGEFETRKFPQARQEILEFLLALHRKYHPEMVFVHTRSDVHQDHNTITDEALRAFRGTTLLGYDVIRSSHGFFPHFLVEVSEEDVQRKIEALSQYTTYRDKYYFNADLTRASLIRNGALAERPYAEGFDILCIVGRFGKE